MAGSMAALSIAFVFLCSAMNLHFTFAVRLKLTNLQCVAEDENLASFYLCKLRVVRRGVIALNIRGEVKQKVTSFIINAAHFQKANGYKPFLFNTTFDFCLYKANNSAYMLAKVFITMMSEFSNLNHTCPYDHDLIFKDLILTEDKFRIIPLPTGDYMEQVIFYFNGKLATTVKVFYNLVE